MQSFKILARTILLGSSLILLSISPARASLLVDTGPGTQSGGGTTLFPTQWLAGQFTLTSSQNIGSVEGWFGSSTDGTAHSTIYGDNGSGAPIGAALFSQQFTLDAPIGSTDAWDGAYGLNWGLTAGTYWLAFEILAGDTASNYMPNGAASPLAAYAFNPSSNGYRASTRTLGFRINSVSPIPVPAAVWLFGTALIGFVGMSRRRKVA